MIILGIAATVFIVAAVALGLAAAIVSFGLDVLGIPDWMQSLCAILAIMAGIFRKRIRGVAGVWITTAIMVLFWALGAIGIIMAAYAFIRVLMW